jgi:hypothetical protein
MNYSVEENDYVIKSRIKCDEAMLGIGARSSVVVNALCYKPEGRGFDTRWGEILYLPNLSGRTMPWGSLSL